MAEERSGRVCHQRASMRIVLLGPPGSGKGTQAARLAERFKIPHLSTGEMLRAAFEEGTAPGRLANDYMKAGQLVPDELIIPMLLERLEKIGPQAGFILDGFPRTWAQAEALEAALSQRSLRLEAALLIDIPDELSLERITGRRSDPITGAIYHVKYNPPPPEVADRVVHRQDDTVEAVISRLAQYHAEEALIVPFYEQRGLLRRVNGNGTPDEVGRRIAVALGSVAL